MTDTSRDALIKRLAEQWATLDPADHYRADVGLAVDMLEADKRLNVGDSHFESWYSELQQAGKGSKQIAREAYEAGMNDKAQQVAVPDERAELLHHISGHIGWANRMDYAALSETLHRVHDMLEADKPEPLSEKQIAETYYEGTCQPLRSQDKTFVFAFARAIEAAHNIKAKP